MAQRTEIDAEINALSVHCRPPIMEVDQRASWTRDWCNDLAEYPIEAIRIACRKWRQSGATKFPTPGQILPLIRENLPRETAPRVEAWREASPQEYQAMTLREKIRELTIQSHEAHTKAGPMFRNEGGTLKRPQGNHLTLDDFSPAQRAWLAEGDRLSVEAKRLREILHNSQSMAAE